MHTDKLTDQTLLAVTTRQPFLMLGHWSAKPSDLRQFWMLL